ncbi:preprotein translocase subunit SecY [Patescibacteria group bacterium]|nr:preprotein translocase subunit SecY [Patescibacteria group bacterium]MBU1500550.1 preprotein translocase subunit SecY [Patescibacteria group bacterium]MBU2080439.1 preprotein translocase subunit SecY [Patescibacteria group bacterium]MBU2123756.1 preprotein translocase subunit SecY [Patescibacteria group bacterium]MBU2194612.1 preprotein translocase subunit SecY [Patescibacteria group bacterium]
MASQAIHKLKIIFSDATIRNRVLFILAAFAAFRVLAAVPIPGVNRVALEQFFNNNQFLGLLNIFSGGGLSSLSIVMLGVGPYITASIIMQLATVIFPKVKAMYTEEGEAGRTKFISLSRVITVPFAILQSVAFLSLLENQGIVVALTPFAFALNVFLVAAGSMLLMWVGELITEFGIGNGVSLIIFAGIVAGLPAGISQLLFTASAANIPAYVGFTFLALLVVFAVVLVSEAERSIPIHYARATRGISGSPTYLPIRLLQAGVMPIIFALSLLLLPQMVLTGLSAVGIAGSAGLLAAFTEFAANPFAYGAFYFVLVVMFTYFYTSITFEPHRVAENLQKSGAFIPGVRPGRETENYIANVVNRVTLPGATFLGLVAVIPFIIQGITGITAILIGGTALLIVVNVVLDLIRKIDAQASLGEY